MIVETGLLLCAILKTKSKNDVIVCGFPVTAYLLQTHIFPVKWVG
jgi:hypothetical protein